MASTNSDLTAAIHRHRDRVLDLLCECSSRGEKAVSKEAITTVRNETTGMLYALGIEAEKGDRLMRSAEQEATTMWPVEIQKRKVASSTAELETEEATISRNEAAAERQHMHNAQLAAAAPPAPPVPAKAGPMNINLDEAQDELDFITAPYFSASNPLHNSLKNLDLSYRCTICRELYTNPVAVMPCLHTFCSECIRKHCKIMMGGMKRECKCPECNKLIGNANRNYEDQIVPNHHFANQIENYKQMREGLRSALAKLTVLEKERAQGGVLTSGHTVESVSSEGKRKADEVETRSSRRSSRQAAKKARYTGDSSDDENEKDPDFEIVQPPTETKQQARQKITLQRKTVTSYHGMKRKKLVELCSKEGLPSNGSDEELRKRHSEFITLYNSECDAEYPRSVSELVKEIKKRENGRKKEAAIAMQNGSYRHTSCMNNLKQNVEMRGKGGNAALTTGDAQFDAKLNDGFKALIQRAKAGKENKAGAESSESTSGTSETSAADQAHIDLHPESAMSTDTSATEPLPESFHPFAQQQSRTQEQPTSKLVEPANQPSTTPKTLRQKKKKSPSSQVPSRLVNAGPWKCPTCTYMNERNTTAKARCEMCFTGRTKQTVQKHEVEVVNIDC